MVSYDKNLQLKFEVTLSFIMMSYYYVDNLPSMKNARAYACGLVSDHISVQSKNREGLRSYITNHKLNLC